MNLKKIASLTLLSALLFTSCSSDDSSDDTALGTYTNGVLVLNEGNYTSPNASISYISNDLATFQNNVFSLVNPNITLGDTGQDIGFYNNLAFIIVNNSHKIEVVNRYSLEHIATIESGLNNPRYIAFSNGKVFVTNWGDAANPNDDFVAIYSISDYSYNTSVPVAEGPEKIIEQNGKLYIAHSGGWNQGNQITVINGISHSVVTTITVGDIPNALAPEEGFLYVLCEGNPSWTGSETAGKLVKINVSNYTVSSSLEFAPGEHPSHLAIENNAIYYTLNRAIYKTTLNTTSLPTTAFFSTTAQEVSGIYSFGFLNNNFYIGDALDYNSNGKVYIYSSNGTFQRSFTAGISPKGFFLND
jgi:hypothetical protein